jgi:5-formyltetrahydrofolate cyclo-ligase
VNKDGFRIELLKKLSSLPFDELQSLSLKLTNQLIKFFFSFPELTEEVGGAYLPLKAELAPVYQELLRQVSLSLAYPVLKEGQMCFGLPQGMPKGTTWLEPPYYLTEPSWLLVPGLGFDLLGGRLGRGGGYYDRYLEERDTLVVGLAWSEQIVEKVPVEQHDCHMDFIITEDFCWNVNQQIKF